MSKAPSVTDADLRASIARVQKATVDFAAAKSRQDAVCAQQTQLAPAMCAQAKVATDITRNILVAAKDMYHKTKQAYDAERAGMPTPTPQPKPAPASSSDPAPPSQPHGEDAGAGGSWSPAGWSRNTKIAAGAAVLWLAIMVYVLFFM